jgi:hypothetical protein
MKKSNFLNKMFLVFVALSTSVAMFNSCGDKKDDPKGESDEMLIRQWRNEVVSAQTNPANIRTLFSMRFDDTKRDMGILETLTPQDSAVILKEDKFANQFIASANYENVKKLQTTSKKLAQRFGK